MSKTRKQIFRYFISGACATAADFIVYYFLSNFINISLAKGLSYIAGIITSYLMNKYYTFKQNQKSTKEIIKFLCLNGISMMFNVFVNKISFIILPWILHPLASEENYQILKILAFICATGACIIINFTGQKFWVFKEKETNE